MDEDTMFWTLKSGALLLEQASFGVNHIEMRLAPVLPAIVESLHGERPEQSGLNGARTAFLLRNCV